MGNPKGVRRDFEALENRRLAVIKLFGEEFNNSEIGRRLKVCNQTVSRWLKQYEAGGKAAPRKAGWAGRKPRLRAADVQRLGLKSLLTGANKIEPARSSIFAVILLGMRSLELLRQRVGRKQFASFFSARRMSENRPHAGAGGYG